MRLHASVPSPPVADHCPHRVPSRLAALVSTCLAKDPADRPADADRVLAALDACLDGERWTARDAQDWWRDHLPGAVGL
jgi:hypothetical protein